MYKRQVLPAATASASSSMYLLRSIRPGNCCAKQAKPSTTHTTPPLKFLNLHAFDSTPSTSFYGASTQPDTGYGSKVAGRLPLANAARNMRWDCGNAQPLSHLLSLVRVLDRGLGIVLCLEQVFLVQNTNYGILRVLPLQSSGAATALRGLCPRSLAACTTTSPRHISRKSPASYTPILPHGARDGPLSEAIGRRLTPQRNP
ncbi:hypothetical protein LI328DRAFT_158398 [Trichoderma asperelloides]|nr:hypothetical protein LI328DRAFT_158398 [Trichoderma asperelloides]